jgi:hypothetical protein
MSCIDFRKAFCLLLIITFGFLGTRCATPKEEHAHGEVAPVKTYPKDYVHPLTEINLEKVVNENRGLKVLEENATTVHDYYRGAVQEKAEGENLVKENKWEEGRIHLEKSNRFLRVVLRYLSEDEAYRNIYGDHVEQRKRAGFPGLRPKTRKNPAKSFMQPFSICRDVSTVKR